MLKISRTLSRTTALAAVLGVLALGTAVHAAPSFESTNNGPPNSTVTFDSNGHVIQETPDTSSAPTGTPVPQQRAMHRQWQSNTQPAAQQTQSADTDGTYGRHGHHHDMSPESMNKHVEARIKTLHEKLRIMPQQESAWSDVAQAMRDSEANVSALIQERHQTAEADNAIEDLESYHAIVQAHADGLKKVITAFKPLYDEMTPDQKKNADGVFNDYEGRGKHDGQKAKHKSSTSTTKQK